MNISIYCFYIFNRRSLLHKMELKCYEMLWNVYVNVRKCICNIKRQSLQLLQKILLTIIRHTQCEKIHLLLIVTTKKPTPTFCHSRPGWFAVCHCKATLCLQNVHADTFKYRKIKICKLFKKFSNYKFYNRLPVILLYN